MTPPPRPAPRPATIVAIPAPAVHEHLYRAGLSAYAPLVPLTGKQRRYLRSLGHHLEPVVQLGKHGLTEGVTAAVDAALEEHELVKVRLGTECPDDRTEVADRLGPAVHGEVAQVLGRTILLYRRHPKEPKIKLPRGE